METRVGKLESDLYRLTPADPGVMLRLDRQDRQMERLQSIVKYVVTGGGIGLVWEILRAVVAFQGRTP